jgi:hypothetical protein
MKRFTVMLAVICLAALALSAAPAQAPAQATFGLNGFDVTFTNPDGTPATQAGSHPFAMTTSFGLNVDGEDVPVGWVRSLLFEQVPGLLGDTTAYKRCTSLQFLEVSGGANACPRESAVGITAIEANEPGAWISAPLFNLTPPPGVLLRLGFSVLDSNVVVDVGLSTAPPYNPLAAAKNISQLIEVTAGKTQLWGDPSDFRHDGLRGNCGIDEVTLSPGEEFHFEGSGSSCPVDDNPRPFLTVPGTCQAPLLSRYEALSWAGDKDAGSRLTHDAAGNPEAFGECGSLPAFTPTIGAKPTSRSAASPTGLDFTLGVDDEGLTSVGGRSQSRIRKAVVTLPEGMTANPSVAEGLEVCSEADLARETLSSAPGEGCPEASKIGTIEVESPLVDEPVKGALYQAEPHANLADNSLIAFYMVLKNTKLGIIVKQTAKVEPDPQSGRLVAIADEIPQVAFSEFRLHFREGGRSPLVTPPTCGPHQVSAELTPWSGGAMTQSTSTFQIVSGPSEGPCPSGPQPFEPGFAAGAANNSAGAYSPFSMRLTRRDGDQDLTRFDATLPPGVAAKLAGVDKCPDAQIALAKAKSGKAELNSPSCPANSRIGTVLGGAGVGSQLTYVRGAAYLAGPFAGAPLSAVGIVPAVAGPFDVGTVVVREALTVNPRTGEVSVDGAHSDPIPHILAGIPLVVRDVQVHVDRPGFAFNPTSCDPFATKAEIWGGGSNPLSTADDSPVARQARFQAAECARLGFKPRLSLRLKGGTSRGAHPKLRGTYRPRPGDANIKGLVLRLPRSAFLDQAHIRTICTRVQFAAKSCPPGAVYGHARVFTPILSEPLEGPVYLRSSSHNLPDFVASLHGLIDVELVARIDSKKGGIRATFTNVPDAPVSKAVVNMQGAKKGLIVNSRSLCGGANRANADLEAQNGKQLTLTPPLQADCGKGAKRKR